MNEEEFLKQLNSKSNSDGFDTYPLIDSLLREHSRDEKRAEQLPVVPTKKESFFKRIFSFLKREEVDAPSILPEEPKEKSPRQIINDNLDNILEKILNAHYSAFVSRLAYNDDLIQIVNDNIEKILDRFPKDRDGQGFKKDFLKTLMFKEKGKEVIGNNIDAIMQQDDFSTIDALALTGISEEIDGKLNDFLSQNPERLAKELLADSITYERDEEIEKYAGSVSLIIQELMKSENANFTDIKTLTPGGYSKVYQIGSKILKMGTPRRTYEMPNHPRILQPIARANLKGEDQLPFECIEVADAVEEFRADREVEDDMLYKIYKELREEGIVWTDAKVTNLGVLKRNNTQQINGEQINIEPESLGFSRRLQEGVFSAGDIVILDTDYIYDENDPNIDWPSSSDSKKLEKIWKSEKDAMARAKMQADKDETIKDNDGGR